MKLKAQFISRIRARSRAGWTGSGLTILCGLALWHFPIGDGLEHLSFDLPTLFYPKVDCSEVLMITIDDQSYVAKGLNWGESNWPRSDHAALLRKLKIGQSRLVVFDVYFPDAQKEPDDRELAEAIKAHGQVVISGVRASMRIPGVLGKQTQRPWTNLLYAARTNWGIAELPSSLDTDLVVRRHYNGTEEDPSLAWAAATLAGAPVTKDPANRTAERWLRYYGGNGTLPALSYHSALEPGISPQFFRDKTIFIGGKPGTRYAGEAVDDFRTPYTEWKGEKTPGVEINATMFLNLLRGEWLSRLSWPKECLLLAIAGLLLGYGLALFRPKVATSLAVLAFLMIGLGAILLVWQTHVWFSWMIIAAAQVPCALGWSVLTYTKALETQLASATAEKRAPSPLRSGGATPRDPEIHDHMLLRCIGRGAYGEVWLAVNAVGLYHAVKIIYRRNFDNIEPYTREFNGIQKYMPVSLKHPGLVHILHVGRKDDQGYFYYVMEAGDDEAAGNKINPETYSPRNLDKDLKRRGKFSVADCISLLLPLTDGLEFLHQQQLIHRDIKPSNIVFVNGVAKLADIGLVTNIALDAETVSAMGTEGFIAPELPGKPPADIYSLGKVLYEAATGLDRRQFPELPVLAVDSAETVQFMRLNAIILKACEANPQRRFQSAAELRASLLDLQRHMNVSDTPGSF